MFYFSFYMNLHLNLHLTLSLIIQPQQRPNVSLFSFQMDARHKYLLEQIATALNLEPSAVEEFMVSDDRVSQAVMSDIVHKVVQIGSKGDESGTFSDQISVGSRHLEKVLGLSDLGLI